MTVRRGAGAVVALVVASLVGVTAPALAAEAGTLSVTPSTDLIDDQLVRVRGEGWPSTPFLVVVQCDARAWDFGGCDESAGAFVEEVHGSFAVEFEVERQIETHRFGSVDCASAPDACIVAALYRPGRILASTPVSFDPAGPPPDPPLALDVDLARSARVGPDGRRVLVNARLRCEPGMHVELFVQVAQENGEDDVQGFGGSFVHRCHGTLDLRVEVRAHMGSFQPGHAVITSEAFGFRPDDGGDEDFAHDFELVRASLSR